jgi:hypothetical protein
MGFILSRGDGLTESTRSWLGMLLPHALLAIWVQY